MKKIERILAIIVLLLENERISTAQLAERFSVTKRTIFRDIETIELAGFPIISHSGRNGGFSLMESFKLRTYTYSGEEKQAILEALDVKEGLFGIFDQQTTIKEKIELVQKTANTDKVIPHFSFESPTMHRPEIELETKQKINQINLALKNKQKLLVDYIDNKGEHTKRLIHPYEVILNNGSWYVYSFCEKRGAFRYFKITRIRQLVLQKELFTLVDSSREKQKEHPGSAIRLQFPKEDLGKLYDYYTEAEIQIVDTHIEVSIYANQQKTILPFLLMFGHGVKVLAPKELRLLHQQEIAKLAQTYDD
ncbi:MULTISPECIES: helix-turn-helix transcriptional regulator [unclassified Enterococcus]|uniref:helix-turn-helix transcriptional regulator n=1 Tax=unclassified Enterococcus TaxID=2608891 RepID=UPI001CE208E0|nr:MULTISPECIES: YafY family protein [unclassified Enterococcus]MCA5013677.1 YafY family transcriptional regulator [Enterococcus sp. S23]MCA5016927.1 YafY family transcriptional regulator [Enterococcus sp. S22(2020)]